MFALTIIFMGIQLAWTVEMAYGFILFLFVSKSHLALVWLAGPISGLVMQPIIGSVSDKSSFRWGKRRPFIVVGTLMVVLSLLVISHTPWLASLLHSNPDELAIFLAVSAIYTLDFAINGVQACARALLVDMVPTENQTYANSMAGRMLSVGNVIGYFFGYLDLPSYVPWFGNNQLQCFCHVVISILLLTVFITCYFVPEKASKSKQATSSLISIHHIVTDLKRTYELLPPIVTKVCITQFFAWMGWFPFLFFSSTYVAEIWRAGNPNELGSTHATRMGSFTLFLNAMVALTCSFLLPPFLNWVLPRWTKNPKYDPRKHCIYLYNFSHFWFAFAILATYFVSTVTSVIILLALCGISWSITMWVPFGLVGECISQATSPILSPPDSLFTQWHDGTSSEKQASPIPFQSKNPFWEEKDHYQRKKESSQSYKPEKKKRHILFIGRHPVLPIQHPSSNCKDLLPGSVLGIHNMYIVLPQFLMTLLSSVVFWYFELHEARENDPHTIGFVLRCGAILTLMAGFYSFKLHKDTFHCL